MNPTPFGLNAGIEYLFMAVVGGAGYVWGAVLGAGVVTILKDVLQGTLPVLFKINAQLETIVFGALLVLLLQVAPGGLWPRLLALLPQVCRPGAEKLQWMPPRCRRVKKPWLPQLRCCKYARPASSSAAWSRSTTSRSMSAPARSSR